MLDEGNAAALMANGRVFCLTAAPETILARLADDGGRRPLLDVPEPAQQIERLLEKRQAGYGRFSQIATDDKTPGQVAAEILQMVVAGC